MFYNPPVHLTLGLLAFALGVFLCFDVPLSLLQASHVERLPVMSAAQLADAPVGREALLEGQLSGNTPPVYRSFVAYVREEYRTRLFEEGQHWVEVERVTPPLLVSVGDGEALIANDDYTFEQASETVEEAEPTFTKGAVQSRGFTPGAQVLVIGSVVADGIGRAFHAEQLYPGTRAQYLAELRRVAGGEAWFGAGALVLGLAELVLGGFQLRRFLREDVAAQTQEAPASQPRKRARRRK